MPKERKKSLCMDTLRHAEYYGMLQTFDDLYAKSKSGEKFPNLMELILSQDNIMLAYRNIKSNTGSYTAGTDHQNIGDIGKLPPSVVIEKVRKIVTGSQHGYRPKPVRRKDIPKPNGKTRPLGIPCIWDRLIQQCISHHNKASCAMGIAEIFPAHTFNLSRDDAVYWRKDIDDVCPRISQIKGAGISASSSCLPIPRRKA